MQDAIYIKYKNVSVCINVLEAPTSKPGWNYLPRVLFGEKQQFALIVYPAGYSHKHWQM